MTILTTDPAEARPFFRHALPTFLVSLIITNPVSSSFLLRTRISP
jgi:hypothetical protein